MPSVTPKSDICAVYNFFLTKFIQKQFSHTCDFEEGDENLNNVCFVQTPQQTVNEYLFPWPVIKRHYRAPEITDVIWGAMVIATEPSWQALAEAVG